MEYLSRLLNEVAEKLGFRYHPRCKKKITHVLFANNLLLFYYGELNSIKILMDAFDTFSKALSLRANLEKCDVFLAGVSYVTKYIMVQNLGMPLGFLLFRYLGVP